MKTIYINFIKKNYRIIFAVCGMLMLFAFYSCVEDENIQYSIYDEAKAAIGFVIKEGTATEGGSQSTLQINASKNLFNDVSFDLVVVSGDASGITITDDHGNTGTTFTISKGTKTANVKFTIIDNSDYSGDSTVTFGLTNLTGNGVFLPVENVGNSENKLYVEFALTVVEDEPVPPSISFTAISGNVNENDTEAHKAIIQFTSATLQAGSFDVAFGGTAVADTDYTAAATGGLLTVNFDAGTETIEVAITPIDNVVINDDKTVILAISNPSSGFFLGDVLQYTLSILENDVPETKTTILAEMDAWTRGKNGSTKSNDNGGDKTDLVASDGNGDNDLREFYLKFDLTGIDPAKVTEAKIVLTTTRESSWGDAEANFGGITTQNLYHVTDDSWGEMSITANTKPASGGAPIASFTSGFLIGGTSLSKIEHVFDVTAQLQVEADGKLSVRLNTVNTLSKRIFYASKEHINNTPPKLIIIESL